MSRKRRNRRHKHRRRQPQQQDTAVTPPQNNNVNNNENRVVPFGGRPKTPTGFRSNALLLPKTPNVETPKGRFGRAAFERSTTIGTQTLVDYSFAQIFETPKVRCGFSPYGFFAPPHGAISTPLGRKELFVNEFSAKEPCVKDLFCPDFTPKEKSLMEAIVFDKAKVAASLHRHRFYKSASPKKAHAVDKKTSRTTTASAVPKSFSPVKRFTIGCFENGVNANAGCVCNRLLARLRAFHRNYVSRWAGRFVEACAWFGLTIKMGLVAIYRPRRADVAATTKHCNCEEKVRQLETEMQRTRTEHECQLKTLKDELETVRTELDGLREIRKEISKIKAKLTRTNSCGDADGPQKPPPPPQQMAPPPPPPPPPPLPPLMPVLGENTPTGRIKINRNKAERKTDENARPIISLDDILKVKLRKTGDRVQQPVRLLQRRATQPAISTDMLRQVKLRPASRPQTPLLSDVSAPATSPARSLSIILNKVDTNEIAARHLQT